MSLPENVVKFFANPASRKTIATIDAEGTVYAAPFGSIQATPDGSAIILVEMVAEETPKRLEYMKQAGKMAVVVAQISELQKGIAEGYCVWCNVGDRVTAGPLFDKVMAGLKEMFPPDVLKVIMEKFTPKAVWTFRPVKYKVQGMIPDRGKIVTL